ncbi:GNAT family N-acetyltransferase [Geobacter sp. DSM 9736]|uniref:GNAT family N-acetyltransferase n=1 Tax=Geobacter sp. DSM 9736 TaxID=1277350 RepID=UPI000B500277|nr:GNAT family N-acetyltransferase [Geobacter sp. DSM 9736]SNB45473.1 Acetyltransferase (GNAT) family protein [Geobacter sp. DSM 9736]
MKSVKEITEQLLTGAAIADALDDLATLRLEIFQEYPYLYRGLREDELTYLGTYAEAPDACVILAYDGSTVIGAATGMPLIHEDAKLRGAFAGTALPLNEVYYVGELLFRPAYRNCGFGRKLLAQLENHIRSLCSYHMITCATVERPEDHPSRPRDYVPITRFLAHTGFARVPGATVHFTWLETDGAKRDHTMSFWSKELI